MSQPAILSGTLQDLDLSMVMDVTSLGRQTLRLEVISASGAMIGFVVLKAGRVVSAQAGSHRGQAALALILHAEARAQFRVVRDTTDVTALAPVAMVGEPIAYSRTSSSSFAEGTQPKIRVMEGSLSDFDVPTLLQTIGMGRSYIEVDVLSESGEAIGSVFLKSGKVVSAHAGSFEGLQAVRQLVDCPKHFQFAVFRVDDQLSKGLQSVDPVGGLSQVLMEAVPHSPRLPAAGGVADRTPIMAGLLSEFDVPTLLQTVGSGRQFIGLEVHEHGVPIGHIMVKAGMVMSAEAGALTGVAAFRKLVQSPVTCGFNVFRTNAATDASEPLGPMQRLLMLAMEPDQQPPPSEPSTAERIAVMAGDLAEVGMVELLEALTQNRQHTVVEIARHHHVLGAIHLKAGMVCGATMGAQKGVPAFHSLLGVPADSRFCVFRQARATEVPMPLGTVADLVRSATGGFGATASVPALGPDVAPQAEAPEAVAAPQAVAPQPIAPAKRRGAPWIGVGIVVVAVAAGVFTLWPKQPAAPVTPPEPSIVSMAVQESPPPVSSSVPVRQDPVVAAPPTVAQLEAPTPAPVRQAPPVVATPPVAAPQPALPTPAPVRAMTIRQAQTLLAKLGYAVGPVDNILGPKTRAALTAFQSAQGLEATGAIDAATVRVLAAK